MPRDRDGQWIPEPHKAETYTPEQIQAGTKTAKDFTKAASPNMQEAAPKAQPVAAATTVQTVLTPDGTTRLQPNVQQSAKQRAASKAAETYREESARDSHRHWLAKELTKEFQQAHTQEKAKDRDLER